MASDPQDTRPPAIATHEETSNDYSGPLLQAQPNFPQGDELLAWMSSATDNSWLQPGADAGTMRTKPMASDSQDTRPPAIATQHEESFNDYIGPLLDAPIELPEARDFLAWLCRTTKSPLLQPLNPPDPQPLPLNVHDAASAAGGSTPGNSGAEAGPVIVAPRPIYPADFAPPEAEAEHIETRPVGPDGLSEVARGKRRAEPDDEDVGRAPGKRARLDSRPIGDADDAEAAELWTVMRQAAQCVQEHITKLIESSSQGASDRSDEIKSAGSLLWSTEILATPRKFEGRDQMTNEVLEGLREIVPDEMMGRIRGMLELVSDGPDTASDPEPNITAQPFRESDTWAKVKRRVDLGEAIDK